MEFIYLTDDTQYAYSAGRQSVAEYYKRHDGNWSLAGWMWDGQAVSLTDAKEKLTEYLAIFKERV
jgi:hypothetical protein